MLGKRAGVWLIAVLTAIALAQRALPAAAARPLLPGDPAPPLRITEWVQKGVFDQVRPVDRPLVTVIEFWASWDPLSRAILPGHDARQGDLRDRGIRFLTIAEEQREDAQAYLRQAKLQGLAVVSDPEGEILRLVVGTDTELPCPFAVITEERPSAQERRVFWLGPVVNDPDSWARCSGYQDDLDTALAKVLAGTFDVAAARAAEVRRREFYELAAEAQANALAGHFDKAVPFAREVQARTWPPELARMRQDALTNIAFFLAEDAWSPVWEPLTAGQPFPLQSCLPLLADPSRKARAALALELVKTARELAGRDDAVLLHITARAQAALGDLAGALDTQRLAMKAPRPHGQFLQMDWVREVDLPFAAYVYEHILSGAPIFDFPQWEDSPATLTAAQAVADLRQLHDLLRLYHPGYDDAAWELARAGSSWEEHTEELAKRLESHPTLTADQFWQLLSDEYLAVIADKHTLLLRYGTTDAGPRYTNQICPTVSQPPFFAEVRVREADGRLAIAEAPDDLKSWVGAEVVGVPVIGSPTATEPRRAYLFPTLPRAASKGAKEYLVGLLWGDRIGATPSKVTVTLRAAAGVQQVALPLHRGRTALDQQQRPPWTLREGPVPVLEVRSMLPGQTDGLPETANALRTAPLLVLDLRRNGGGFDDPAAEWCARLTGHRVVTPGGICNIRSEETDPLRRFNTLFGETWWGRVARPVAASSEPFRGQLVVLADNETGSAAEILLRLASRIPDTLIVGENTAGCMTYGNKTQIFLLKESKLVIEFGWTKAACTTRPFREGLGHFPDYWLDTEDPVGAIVEYVDQG